jgi:hypothetical protein
VGTVWVELLGRLLILDERLSWLLTHLKRLYDDSYLYNLKTANIKFEYEVQI